MFSVGITSAFSKKKEDGIVGGDTNNGFGIPHLRHQLALFASVGVPTNRYDNKRAVVYIVSN
ncbi:MAG: hypothetical protein B6D61_14135 [Bacteroidetes bacterium 4484_249]|nr:MAG: hypothetical protein B6D61_14135 [Bacteroidetes bacterium 4484_249]